MDHACPLMSHWNLFLLYYSSALPQGYCSFWLAQVALGAPVNARWLEKREDLKSSGSPLGDGWGVTAFCVGWLCNGGIGLVIGGVFSGGIAETCSRGQPAPLNPDRQ